MLRTPQFLRKPLAIAYRHAKITSILIALLSFLLGTATNWLPSVQIDTGPTIDNSSIFGTEFRYWNSGRLPVYNAEMVCKVDAKPFIYMNGNHRIPVDKLSPRHSVERDCGVTAPGMAAHAKYVIRVYYSWPMNIHRTWVEQTFSSFVNQDGKVIIAADSE